MIKGKSFTIFFSSIIPLLIFLFCAEPTSTDESSTPIPTASTTTPIVSINDTIQLQGTANDLYGSIVKWEWDAGNTGTFIETTPDSSYTTLAPSTANSTYPCILRVTDDDGNVAADTVTIDVLLDAPNPTVSTTTLSVSINDTIQLHGTANDIYGSIVKWEWDAGNTGTFIETTPDSSYTTAAPSTANSTYPCILRVTDDDGNVAADTVTIDVLLDEPIPTASTTTPTVSINDTLQYQGTATDAYGNIVKWEWDAGNSGTFVETTPDSSYIAIAPSIADSVYPCVLKVTDNDGNVAVDTVTVNVLIDLPVPSALTTTPVVSINDTLRCQGTATDEYGNVVKWEWDAGNSGTFVETTPDSSYTAIAPSIADSVYPCILRVTDDDGNVAADTITIDVLLDAPIPTASTTTPNVVINDTIRLQGTAVDAYGTIEKWEWDVGNVGEFVETTPDSSYKSLAPSVVNSSYPCVLRVTDDDGNKTVDTVIINVLPDWPIPTASSSTLSIAPNDTIRLFGTATDIFGTIIKWEWDAGNTGTFIETTPDSNFSAISPATPNDSYLCILRVTDNDYNVASDTVRINVLEIGTVTDIDGNVYRTVRIGNQVWTAENLRTTKYNDGTPISHIEDSAAWGIDTLPAYCYYKNTTNTDSIAKFGALYNWYAINTGKLAPAGWHVPTGEELTELENYLIAHGHNWDGTTTGNKIGKSMATQTYWDTSTTVGNVGNDPSSNNSSGFSGLPGGYRYGYGSFVDQGSSGYWWSSWGYGASGAVYRYLLYNRGLLNEFISVKGYGLSVRLLRD